MPSHAHLMTMGLRAALLICALSAVGSPAAAREGAAEDPRVEEYDGALDVDAIPPPAPEEALTKDEFMERVSGKVIVYVDPEGEPYGEEYFDPDQDRVTWRYLDGGCQSADWTAEGSLFCFNYDERSCWRVQARKGGWTAHLIEADGSSGQWVRIARVENRRLDCAPELMSLLPP